MFRREVLNPFREHEQIRNIIDWGVRVSHVVRGPTTAAAAAAAQPRLEVGAAWQTGQMFLLRARADNDGGALGAAARLGPIATIALSAHMSGRTGSFERVGFELELGARDPASAALSAASYESAADADTLAADGGRR